MFTVAEFRSILEKQTFRDDSAFVRTSLLNDRYGQKELFAAAITSRLSYFVDAVLASAPEWTDASSDDILRTTAEISEMLSNSERFSQERRNRMLFRSMLLYELAGIPALSGALAFHANVDKILSSFFQRIGIFGKLNGFESTKLSGQVANGFSTQILVSDAIGLADFEQGKLLSPLEPISTKIATVASHVQFDLNCAELNAFAAIVKKRRASATIANVSADLFDSLKTVHFPCELWEAQVAAIKSGLVDESYDSWGFAAPTGTGKTFLAILLMVNHLMQHPDSKILYLVPSKALVYEVESKKADMLLRIGYSFLSEDELGRC
jgi:Type III restriction enzyme, res subunit